MAGRVVLSSGLRVSDAKRKIPPRRSLLAVACLLVQVLVQIPVQISLLGVLVEPSQGAVQPVKGTVSTTFENGFARLVFFLDDDVESKVRASDNIIVITFDRPVDINVDRLTQGANGYIGAARRDPDGKAVRIALARKVTVNSMAAGERLFVDLLPDTWSGLPPGLPREVIEELARRARDAEKKARQERPSERDSKPASIRVRVASQPTFTRYTFELPESAGVSAENGKDKLTLTFSAPLNFDLADAKANLPRAVQKVDSEADQDSAIVRFTFGGKVDVRSFREDNSYVVDISPMEAKATRKPDTKGDGLAGLAADLMTKKTPAPDDFEKPQTVPAQAAPIPAPQTMSAPEKVKPAAATVPAPVASPVVATPVAATPVVLSPVVATPIVPSPAVSAPVVSVPADAEPAPVSAPVAAVENPDQAAPPPPREPAAPNSVADQPPPQADAAPADPNAAIKVLAKLQGDNLTLRFPFPNATPGAVFRRADTLWLVFDTGDDIKLPAATDESGNSVKNATVARQGRATVVRVKLDRPRLISVATEGATWVVNLGSQILAPTRPLTIVRNGSPSSRASATIMMSDPRTIHQLQDPDVGDALLVVTALTPARGFISTQEFVEFRVLSSAQGAVIQPLADDFKAELAPDQITLSRPNGLSLTVAALNSDVSAPGDLGNIIDARSWTSDRGDDFRKRQSQLIFSAAKASDAQRLKARVDLARFYLAREMSAEAKGILDIALKDDPPTAVDPMPLVLRAVANILLGRSQEALKDLANPLVGNRYDAPLWRALAYARQGRWSDAHEGFYDVDAQLAALPIELQQKIMKDVILASIEVGDVTAAMNAMHEFEAMGIPHEFEPSMSVINGKLAERMGRVRAALQSYQSAADSWDRPSAAQGQLREIALQESLGKLRRADAIANLETLTTIWRGDDTEIEALKLLSHLYTVDGRYRDSFHVMRTALMAHPNSQLTSKIQDEAAETFENVFLAGRGDSMQGIDALALFYDFRDLTPIGRRGDEMIRRLSDRLVSVDLLDQAADLLQYQVEKRLQGAARAQVATRLAVIYLMNRKPDRALATLRATRVQELSNDLRQQRLMIEARALSDTGRNDVALEVIGNIDGREAVRLRSDILWTAKRWREAAEQIELLYGDRWKEFTPLDDAERPEILRGAAGYALGEDALGLGRFRERYVGKMGAGPDRRIFDVLTEPIDSSGTDFRAIAHTVAAADTLEGFLRDLRARYPEAGTLPAKVEAPKAEAPFQDPPTTQSLSPLRREPGLRRTAAR